MRNSITGEGKTRVLDWVCSVVQVALLNSVFGAASSRKWRISMFEKFGGFSHVPRHICGMNEFSLIRKLSRDGAKLYSFMPNYNSSVPAEC